MSAQKTRIHFQINKGNVKVVDVNGAGQDCQALTGEVEKALGTVDEKTRERTSAFYEPVDKIKLQAEG